MCDTHQQGGKSMSTNPVIETIYAAFKIEIANQFTLDEATITLTLPNQSRVEITAPRVDATTTPHTNQTPIINAAHTYHYTQQNGRLLLHNLEECRVYLDDVCQTFLNATIRDNEVTFPDNTAYLVMVTPLP